MLRSRYYEGITVYLFLAACVFFSEWQDFSTQIRRNLVLFLLQKWLFLYAWATRVCFILIGFCASRLLKIVFLGEVIGFWARLSFFWRDYRFLWRDYLFLSRLSIFVEVIGFWARLLFLGEVIGFWRGYRFLGEVIVFERGYQFLGEVIVFWARFRPRWVRIMCLKPLPQQTSTAANLYRSKPLPQQTSTAPTLYRNKPLPQQTSTATNPYRNKPLLQQKSMIEVRHFFSLFLELSGLNVTHKLILSKKRKEGTTRWTKTTYMAVVCQKF